MIIVEMAVAVLRTPTVEGDVVVSKNGGGGVDIKAVFWRLPPGQHGFHIHKAGDLRGEGCKGACDHYHVGPPSNHGGPPRAHGGPKGTRRQSRGHLERHTGDLGNIEIREGATVFRRTYHLAGISVEDLWGRSVIVHADPDDLGKGPFEDSLTTGHSGGRIACAIFGRV